MKKLMVVIWLGCGLTGQAQEEKKVNAQVSGQWRTFYMGTFHQDSLKDFQALASGGKLGLDLTLGPNWSFGTYVYASLNTNIQDLTAPDPTTGRVSRYEAGLFDVTDLDDDFILFPGEMFVQYQNERHRIKVGRMKIKSPLINGQDGRMIPTLEQGLWYSYRPEKWLLELGVFNEMAPRSTSGFSNIGETLGAYPVGRNADGSQSLYRGNTDSDFILLAHAQRKGERVSWESWNYWVDNVSNTLYVQPTWKITDQWSLGAEVLAQHRLGDGGNAVDSLRYFTDASAYLGGLQLSRRFGQHRISLGYDHIFKGGRFLFPREWGREFLFSFQKRERSEGTADNHALVAYYDRSFGKKDHKTWRIIFSAGHHWKPDVTNAADNKYAIPNYYHLNLDVFWMPEKIKGLRPELLLTYKGGTGDIPDNPNFFLNKVDLFQVNAVVNYNF